MDFTIIDLFALLFIVGVVCLLILVIFLYIKALSFMLYKIVPTKFLHFIENHIERNTVYNENNDLIKEQLKNIDVGQRKKNLYDCSHDPQRANQWPSLYKY